ncbi:MAG: HlyD family efflux transporter periplasmic adaptor subunit [Bryobacterales bacterium]|nr:HlyD family efflux transporter periplasmic adaptor subunit [Bryobacterales bacterium]
MAERKSKSSHVVSWIFVLAGLVAIAYAGLQFWMPATREVPTARVERKEFVQTVRTRGEVKSMNTVPIAAPQTPDLQIVWLAADGKPIKRGDVVVQFDPAAQEERYLEESTEVRQVDSEIVQAKAQHSIADELNAMLVMRSEYDLERAKLEASKQEILSEIEGLKNRIIVKVSEGDLSKAQTTARATDISQESDIVQLEEKKNKAMRDLERTKGYLGNMVLRAPVDGVVQVRPNPRAQGSSRRSRPPFQEGDSVWAGAEIVDIPDLSTMVVEFRVEEIDRGRTRMGQKVRARVDAVAGAVFEGKVEWLSPIATLIYRRFPPEKNFPARARIDKMDDRLRPGMSASVEVIVEERPDVLVIPSKASFQIDGKPTVFVRSGNGFRKRTIEVLARNANEIVVSDALSEGEVIALENPELNSRKQG